VKFAKEIYIVSLMFSLAFFLRGSNNIVMTSLPLYVKDYFSFNPSEIGILAATISTSMFISSGIINPYFPKSRKWVVRISSIAYGIILPLISLSTSISVWLYSAVVGLAAGMIFPNVITMSSEINDRKTKERAISLYTVALSLSLIVGPYMESLILRYYPIKEVFLFFSPFGIAVAVLSFFLKFPLSSRGTVSLSVVKSLPFILAIINNTSYDVPFAAITTFAGVLEISKGISTEMVALSFSLYFLTSFFSRMLMVVRPVNRVLIPISVSLIIAFIGLLGISFSSSLFQFLLWMAILGIPHGFTYPVSLTILSRGFPDQRILAANSLFFSLMSIVAVITPLLVGYVASLVGISKSFLSLEPLVIFSLAAITILSKRSNLEMRYTKVDNKRN